MSILQDIDGATVLDDTHRFIKRFCAFPDEHCLVAVTLWAAHTHVIEQFHTTPRLALLSPEPGSGKTRVLEVLDTLVADGMMSLSVSPAAIFRTLQDHQVALLLDEVDAIWSSRGKDDNHEDLRALLNAGYKRSATIPRCVGPRHEVVQFPVFCAVALAGLGRLPDTIMTRSVIIKMRRRARHERVEQWRTRIHEPQGCAIRDRLALWSAEIQIGGTWPVMPDGVEDRPAEIWEPLLILADAAGGHWPETARKACVHLCRVAEDRRVSLGVRLLSDLRILFGDTDAIYTDTLLRRLTEGDGLDEDAPWSDIRGKPITTRMLAGLLKDYDIKPRKVREFGTGPSKQGYRREDLWDAWERYLSPDPETTEHPEHPSQPASGAASPVPDSPHATGTSGTYPEHLSPPAERPALHVPHVPDSTHPESATDEVLF
jgi:hypothetical protein